jgi:protein subunit release factor B
MKFPVELNKRTLEKAEDLSIRPSDIEEQFIRGGGSGGQKINKTSSCVWLRHKPTDIEVKVQEHREQSRNRVAAYKLLIDKIEEKRMGAKSERAEKRFRARKQKARRSRKAKQKMLEEKKHHSKIKNLRKPPEFPNG